MSQHDRHSDVNGNASAAEERQPEDAPARKPSIAAQQINENLRRIYQEKLEEEIPEHLSILLQRLKEQDRLR